MKILNFFKKLALDLYSSIKRFPAPIMLAFFTSVLMIIINHLSGSASEDFILILTRITMTVALGIPISLCLVLLFEKFDNLNKFYLITSYVISAGLLVLYYFYLLTDVEFMSGTRYAAVSLALYLAFMFIPYLLKREIFELYIIKLFVRLFVTGIYAQVLAMGVFAIIAALDQLLGVPIPERIYADVGIITAGVFAPCFFLAKMPKKSDVFENTDNYPKAFKILLAYIVMPIISVYTAILYAYFIKIAFSLSWPNGLVGHLVLWYSIVSTIVIFFVSPIKETNKWIKAFIFWFTKVSIPLLILLFVSVGIRVNAYGITENRYFVIVLALWVLGMMIYLNISKNKRNIIMLISLSLIAVISVFGPFSSYSVSKFSQNSRFENILNKYDMISDNKIVKSKSKISDKDKKEISAILSYFADFHSYSDVKYLPKDYESGDLNKVFGFKYESDWRVDYGGDQYFSYTTGMSGRTFELKGYDYMFTVNSYEVVKPSTKGTIGASSNFERTAVTIEQDEKAIYTKNISDIVKNFSSKSINEYDVTKYNLTLKEATILDENSKVKVKIIVNNINGNKIEGEFKVDSFEMLIFAKLK